MTVAQVNREELAWAAGFFDGEGSITCKRKSGKLYSHVQLAVGQSGEEVPEVLVRFQNAIDPVRSSITGPYVLPGNRRPSWKLHITNFEGVQAAMARMWPWLSTAKREQARRAFKASKYLIAERKMQ